MSVPSVVEYGMSDGLIVATGSGSSEVSAGELINLDHHELLVFWVQLLVIVGVARILGGFAKRIGLPSVVGELSAGLILGPTVYGMVKEVSILGYDLPIGFDDFLPAGPVQSSMLLAVSWFSAAFLLVVAGYETDLGLIRRLGKAAVFVTLGSITLPFIGGLIVGSQMPLDKFAPEVSESGSLVFSLFIATAVGVSALAVVAKILGDLGLMRRDVGQITIAAGMANDLIGWVILGVIAGLAGTGELSVSGISITIVALILFLVGALTLGQRYVDVALRAVRRNGPNLNGALTVTIGTMLIFGVITQGIGVEAVLGTFVAGVVLARSRYQQKESEHVIESMTTVLFAPLFFATAGLRLDLALLFNDGAWVWALTLLAVAIGLKFAGSYFGAVLAGLTKREGVVLGAGLNARGALEIIIATIGLSLGVFNETAFTAIVVIPLVASLFASVTVRAFGSDMEGSVVERERLAREEALDKNVLVKNHRILLPQADQANSIVAAQLVQFAWPEEIGATVMATTHKDGTEADLDPIKNVLFGRPVEFNHADAVTITERTIAQSKLGYGVIAVGAVREPGHGTYVSPLVRELLVNADVPVVIVRKAKNLPGRLPGIFAQALVPVVASLSSRAAQELAANLSSQLGTQLTLSHIVRAPEDDSNSFLDLVKATTFSGENEVGERVLAQAHAHALEVRAYADTAIRFAASPSEDIVDHANEIEADLIVVGAQLRVLDGRPSLGTNVEHVLEHAPQTVVAVVMPDERPG